MDMLQWEFTVLTITDANITGAPKVSASLSAGCLHCSPTVSGHVQRSEGDALLINVQCKLARSDRVAGWSWTKQCKLTDFGTASKTIFYLS